MDLKSYDSIIMAVALVPVLGVCIIIFPIWYCCRAKSYDLMLIVMKNIASKKNIDRSPKYLICYRKLQDAHRYKFMLFSIVIISICVQLFFLLAVMDVTDECINDSNLDCFKLRDDVKISDAFNSNQPPVNCSSISKNDRVFCYRVTVFDPERGFIGAAAAYLLFKMLNFCLFVVAHVMLWVAQNSTRTYLNCFKSLFILVVLVLLCVPVILSTQVNELESAIRRISLTVLMQVVHIALMLVLFIGALPWEEFEDSPEYFGDVSLPVAERVGQQEIEMA